MDTKNNQTQSIKKLENETEDKMKIGQFNQGKQKIVEFENLCDENYTIKHDEFKGENEKLTPNYHEFDSVMVKFNPAKSWSGLENFEFSLHRKYKTIGTYVTKINKIANGQNPESRDSYAPRKNSVGQYEFSIKKIDNKKLKIAELANENNFAMIDLENSMIEIRGDYEKLEYYVTAVMLKDKWNNRLAQLMQIDENGNICDNPKYYLEFENQKFEIGDSLPNDLNPYYKQFGLKLWDLGIDFSTSEIQKIEPTQFGGGKKWLYDFLCDNDLMTRKPNNKF